MKTRSAVQGLALFVIGGACGWGLSALVQASVERSRVETLRTAESGALPAALDLLENRDGIEAVVSALEDSGAPGPVPAKNRRLAANALGDYPGLMEPMLALSRAAVDDPDAEVRLESVRMIAGFTHDRIFRALSEIAKSLPAEADAEVKEKKRQLLTMALFPPVGKVSTDDMSDEQLSRESRSRLGETVGEASTE
jgi:hypothetical protein